MFRPVSAVSRSVFNFGSLLDPSPPRPLLSLTSVAPAKPLEYLGMCLSWILFGMCGYVLGLLVGMVIAVSFEPPQPCPEVGRD